MVKTNKSNKNRQTRQKEKERVGVVEKTRRHGTRGEGITEGTTGTSWDWTGVSQNTQIFCYFCTSMQRSIDFQGRKEGLAEADLEGTGNGYLSTSMKK